MTSRPRHPDSPFTSLPTNPGARNHRAGRNIEERIAALEEGLPIAYSRGTVAATGPTVLLAGHGFLAAGSASLTRLLASTGALHTATTNIDNVLGIYFNDDYAITGYTREIRIVGHLTVNNVAPGCDFTGSLRTLTGLSGTSSAITASTVGAAVATTNTVVAPAAGSRQLLDSGWMTRPANDWYYLAMFNSAALAVGSRVSVDMALELRWV